MTVFAMLVVMYVVVRHVPQRFRRLPFVSWEQTLKLVLTRLLVVSYSEAVRMQILKDETQFSRITSLVTLWSKAEKRLHSLFGGLNSWLVEEDVWMVQMIRRDKEHRYYPFCSLLYPIIKIMNCMLQSIQPIRPDYICPLGIEGMIYTYEKRELILLLLKDTTNCTLLYAVTSQHKLDMSTRTTIIDVVIINLYT